MMPSCLARLMFLVVCTDVCDLNIAKIFVVLLSLMQKLPAFLWNFTHRHTKRKGEVLGSIIQAYTNRLVVLSILLSNDTAEHGCLITK